MIEYAQTFLIPIAIFFFLFTLSYFLNGFVNIINASIKGILNLFK